MSRAEQVRDFLAKQDRACTAAEIIAGIGETGNVRAHYTIGVLYREGLLERTGQARGYLYRLGRPVKPKVSREEAIKRRAERERARRSHQGKKTWAEHLAQLAERRRVREAEADQVRRQRMETSQRERAAAKAREEQARAARTPKPKAKPVPKPAPVKVQPSVLRLAPSKPPEPTLQRMETVDEFLARGGKVQRLPGPWERAA